MPLKWMDVSDLSFNCLLLLEEVQVNWLSGWLPEPDLQVALKANPVVEWFFRHKCPSLNDWLDKVMMLEPDTSPTREEIRLAEVNIMRSMVDLLVYALDPAIYDRQPFLGWDDRELTSLTDFMGKTVIDVGAGTGRLAFVAAPYAEVVFAVEPVARLRKYIRLEIKTRNLTNVYPIDGVITDIPLPDKFADITMGGHVFGDFPEQEYRELARVTKPGGMIILCPGNNDVDNPIHQFLVAQGFEWSRFEEPEDGVKRKYWKTIPANDNPA